MWYRFEAFVPNSRTHGLLQPHAETVKYDLRIPPGVIKKVRIRFPPGPNNKVYLRIMLGTHQMWPRGPPLLPERADLPPTLFPQYWFRGDDEPIEWEEHVPTQSGDHWTLEAYADKCDHNHTVAIGFNVIEEDVANPMKVLEDLVAILKNVIGL